MRRPDRLHFDVRGNPIEVGSLVAFNISGHVAIGEVVKTGSPFHIELQHRAAGKSVGHVSRVRHQESIIVLTPSDMP